MRKDSLPLAILFSLVAAFFYTVLGTLIKMSEHSVSKELIVFSRQLVGLIALTPLILIEKKSVKETKPSSFPLHLLRAFSSLAAMYCLVFALKYLPLVDALLLSYTRPLFIPIVVLVWFRKKWSKNTWIGLIVGFLGVALILKPDQKMFDMASLIGLSSAMFGAIAFTCIRKLTKTESANTILFYYLVISVPIAAIPAIVKFQMPTFKEFGLLALIGIFGTIYQMTLTRAYQYAKAFKVASMLYSTVIFAAFFDYLLGDFSLDALGIVGIIFVVIGTYVTVRQKVTPFPPENGSKKT